MIVLARAKLNLTLDVLGRRSDGYHEICSVMVRLALADRLTIDPDPEILVSATGRTPSGESNLVYRAAEALRRAAGIREGAQIRINKRIPVAAGLGGGSADAAAGLLALNELWGLHWPVERLGALGASLGADVPFCLLGQPALAEGIGERLTPLSGVVQIPVVVAVPRVTWTGPKTATVYANFRPESVTIRPNTPFMLQGLREGSARTVAKSLCNVLETAAMDIHPVISVIKESMLAAGAAGVVMAGAGPGVVAVCPGGQGVGKVAEAARRHDATVLITALSGSQGD